MSNSTDAAKKLLEAFEQRCSCPDAAHLAGCRWDEATMLLPELAPDLLRGYIGVVEALATLEEIVDDLNAATGTEYKPCRVCCATEYNAEVGIVHEGDCAIVQARTAVADLEKLCEGSAHA